MAISSYFLEWNVWLSQIIQRSSSHALQFEHGSKKVDKKKYKGTTQQISNLWIYRWQKDASFVSTCLVTYYANNVTSHSLCICVMLCYRMYMDPYFKLQGQLSMHLIARMFARLSCYGFTVTDGEMKPLGEMFHYHVDEKNFQILRSSTCR